MKLEVRGLTKRYGRTAALDGLSLPVGSARVLVLIGPSGGGKSTLLRVLGGLELPDSGTVSINGHTLTPDPAALQAYRRRNGFLFQQFNLFPHLTVLENLTIGPIRVRGMPRAEAETLARTYLDRVHIPEQVDKYPAQLSGGQHQRVAIARSLCMEPRIMLFDEPTSALDPEMINEVLDVMTELARSGMTMVVVTHEMGFARRVADTMVFMEAGRIVETAPPGKFFTDPESERCRMFLDQILAH